jgi:predicted nucleotide-binding protein (sugar kinase/HSP70/actin superfamily)
MLSINIKRKFEMNEGCPFFEKFLRFLLKKIEKSHLTANKLYFLDIVLHDSLIQYISPLLRY